MEYHVRTLALWALRTHWFIDIENFSSVRTIRTFLAKDVLENSNEWSFANLFSSYRVTKFKAFDGDRFWKTFLIGVITFLLLLPRINFPVRQHYRFSNKLAFPKSWKIDNWRLTGKLCCGYRWEFQQFYSDFIS